jgi:hypothetical protein
MYLTNKKKKALDAAHFDIEKLKFGVMNSSSNFRVLLNVESFQKMTDILIDDVGVNISNSGYPELNFSLCQPEKGLDQIRQLRKRQEGFELNYEMLRDSDAWEEQLNDIQFQEDLSYESYLEKD